MTQYKEVFLSLMRTALGNTETGFADCSEQPWEDIFTLAGQHHVLPMVLDAAHQVYGEDLPWERLTFYKRRAMRITYLQTLKTERFLAFYRSLSEKGLAPLVMKGVICRRLYPEPDFRFSADEDLLIPPEEVMRYHEVFKAAGLKTDSPEEAIASAQEISYRSADGVLFLELHRFAFSPDSGAYGDYNRYFTDVFGRAATETISGVGIRTMAPTDHLFYLICHAIKHFLHGGCGIRQVCDIGMFAGAYGEQVEWTRLMRQVAEIHAGDITAAFFAIAEEHLGIDLSLVPEEFRMSKADPETILEDILESGVYGSSSMSRKHSATITLRAAEAAKARESATDGKRPSRTRTLFPTAVSMARRYPYLDKHPWMLPAAWLQRICRYIRAHEKGNTPGEALRIGRERVTLMKKYGLLSDRPVKEVDTGRYLSALSELIGEGHEVSIPIAGSSMTPFLGDGRDQIFVRSPSGQIRRGDIALYRRRDGSFVLHRVQRVHGKGEDTVYDMIGDAQDRIEHGVRRKQIIAVATRARRKGEIIEPGSFYWWFFQHVWIRMIPLRRIIMRSYAVLYKKQNK